MSSPSSGERYEEEEEEDGAYESQAKRLKPSTAAEEGEIEYSGAEESESRRDKPPAPRGGGFSGGVRDAGTGGAGAPSLRGLAGRGVCGERHCGARLGTPPLPRYRGSLPAEWRKVGPPPAAFPGMEALPVGVGGVFSRPVVGGREWRGARLGPVLPSLLPAAANPLLAAVAGGEGPSSGPAG